MNHTKTPDTFPRPQVAVDGVVFGLDDDALRVLLIRRGLPPFEGRWALPGGFVHIDESVDDAARRELHEETGVEKIALSQLHTYGDVERDPRGRVITIAYTALVKLSDHRVRAATDARDAAWFAVDDLPPLAFDHARIVDDALADLRDRVVRGPVGFELLPKKFTLSMLQTMVERILDRALDKRNFRKKVLAMGVLDELDEVERDVAHRAARLYRFDERQYQRLVREGFEFRL